MRKKATRRGGLRFCADRVSQSGVSATNRVVRVYAAAT